MQESARYLTVTVEATGESFNTKEDWGLYIQNTDCIGNPVQQTNYIQVPGSNMQIDASEAITGRPVYLSREIKVELAGLKGKYNWDGAVSGFRNKVDGRICRVIFSNDANYFWRGRVHIEDTSSEIGVGSLTLSMPEAEPYKYNIQASNEPWLWNPFNFTTDTITTIGAIVVDGEETITIPKGNMPAIPTFVVTNMEGSLTVSDGVTTRNLRVGSIKDPRIIINDDYVRTLKFEGKGTVSVVYRGGSL